MLKIWKRKKIEIIYLGAEKNDRLRFSFQNSKTTEGHTSISKSWANPKLPRVHGREVSVSVMSNTTKSYLKIKPSLTWSPICHLHAIFTCPEWGFSLLCNSFGFDLSLQLRFHSTILIHGALVFDPCLSPVLLLIQLFFCRTNIGLNL